MPVSSKRAIRFLFLPLVLSALLAWPALGAAQTGADGRGLEKTTAAETVRTGPDSDPLPVAPKMIDKTGEKLGRQVDTFSKMVSRQLGDWVSAKPVAGISWMKWILSLLMVFFVAVVERLSRALIERHRAAMAEKKEAKSAKDYIIEALGKPLSLFIWVYGVYGAMTPLFVHFRLPDGTNLVHTVAQKAADLGTAVAIVWFVYRLVDMVDMRLKHWAAATESTLDDMLAPLLGKTLRVFIVIIGAVLIVQNLTGVEIGPLLASLGVGGIAVALAAKDSIANFFGTLTILFDKPFQVGQRVVIEGTDGTIEEVGFRSTRIRTLAGHLVTIPNEKLVNTPIENIGVRPHIRWLNNITITYDTPADKVERAVAILREVLKDHEGMDAEFPPRVFFNGFNDWSLNILMVAWYHPADYWKMQEWQQRTCLEILRRFNEEKIDFAFPSQTVYLGSGQERVLRMLKGQTAGDVP